MTGHVTRLGNDVRLIPTHRPWATAELAVCTIAAVAIPQAHPTGPHAAAMSDATRPELVSWRVSFRLYMTVQN